MHCPSPPLPPPRRAPLPGCMPYPLSSPPATPIPTEALPAAGLSPRSGNSPEQMLPRLSIHGTAELPCRSTSRRLQPLKSTLGESLIIPDHFPGQSRPSLGRIPVIPAAGRAQGPNCRSCFPSKGLTVKIRDLFAKNQFQI
jgi:hypothetical protein